MDNSSVLSSKIRDNVRSDLSFLNCTPKFGWRDDNSIYRLERFIRTPPENIIYYVLIKLSKEEHLVRTIYIGKLSFKGIEASNNHKSSIIEPWKVNQLKEATHCKICWK